MNFTKIRPVFLAGAFVLSALSHADITFYDMFRNASYNQTSTAQPTTAYAWDFTARIFSNTDGDVTAATVDLPSGGGTVALLPQTPRMVLYNDHSFSDQASLDAAYPAGDYTYSVTAGTLAGQGATLTVPTPVYSNEVPFLTGTSFDDLQHATAGNSVNVTWNAFTTSTPTDAQSIYFSVLDQTTNQFIVDGFGDNGMYSSQSIDGSQLVAGHSYLWSLFYDPRFIVNNVGTTGTASTALGFDRITNGTFTVNAVPEPTSMAALGLGAVALLRRRKRA